MNAEVRPGYKQTEVGVIPQDWEVKRLRDISPSQTVGLVINPSSYFDEAGTIPMLVGSHVSENSISWQTANKITEKSNNKISASQLYANDLVMVRVGDPGVTAVIPPELDGCNCASMMIIRQGRELDSNWLCYVMNSDIGRKQVENVQYGTAQKQFNISDATNFIYPTPPIAEQREIASALCAVAALISRLDQLIAKKRDIQQAAMQQLLTGQRRLPGFTGEWVVKCFGEVVVCRSERVDPRSAGRQDFCVELEHIEPRSGRLIGQTVADESSSLKTVFKRQDVLFGKLRAYQRKYWLAERDGVCSTEIWALSCDASALSPEFLYHSVKTDAFIEVASTAYGTHMPRSDWKVMKQFKISLPTFEEQTAIATILSDMDAELAALEARRDKAHQLKQGMMQELLTGRIRLI